MQQGNKRMPGTAVTKSVVANEPGGRKREEIFVDIIEKISVTFSSSVSGSFIPSSAYVQILIVDAVVCYMLELGASEDSFEERVVFMLELL